MSQKKELCYDLWGDVLAILGILELPEMPMSQTESERKLKEALGVAKHAQKTVQELYGIICTEERTVNHGEETSSA
jgi:hypothetical protein